MTDLWVITPAERSKHEVQFSGLGPVNGFITGEQAKKFFLLSRLPPQILGVIWMLSDLDGDGKMNINEFSIACKLISLKMQGFNLPQTLPASLKQSSCVPAVPNQPATITQPSGFHPAESALQTSADATECAPTQSMGVFPKSLPGSVPVLPNASMAGTDPSTGALLMGQMGIRQTVPTNQMSINLSGMSGLPVAPSSTAGVPPVSGNETAAGQVPAQRNSSLDSGGIHTPGEWGVPQASKLKFTQVFNVSDRTKSGFLSGVQARNILIQSQLPQQILAQIWALSDVDNDGRLSCEEFVLALYLCEQAKAGNKIPTVLPPELIPPTLRRSRTSSIQSGGSAGTPVEGQTLSLAQMTDSSFEDKRKENYEKGQAELERRRKALLDAQKRETEERLRREREEESKREKARLEAERKKQEELEREMQRQRELEAQKEMERKRQEELKEQARKDAEKQRQQEWEKQRLQELMNVRQRQQENLLALKAKNQSMSIELSSKDEKVKELTQKISTTRVSVTEVKATIDNMRTTRDTYMGDMNNLKAQARDQNQRLLTLNQERAHLKARSLATAATAGTETAAVEASVTSKQMVIKQLQEKVAELEATLNSKEEDVNNNITEFGALKEQMNLTADRCRELYEEFSRKRKEVLVLREKLLNPDAAWGDTGGTTTAWSGNKDAWIGQAACSASSFSSVASTTITSPPQQQEAAPARPPPPSSGFKEEVKEVTKEKTSWDAFADNTFNVSDSFSFRGNEPAKEAAPAVDEASKRYKALYQFEARSGDELSFLPGDIIQVLPSTSAEAGWLSGQLNDQIGWFPEAYCEPYADEDFTAISNSEVGMVGEPELPILGEGTAIWDWKAQHNNQLSFNKGDTITVREVLDQWYFGELKGISGWFPKPYVKMLSGVEASTSPVTTPQSPPEIPSLPEDLNHDYLSEYYIAVYQYQSLEPGDLVFQAKEVILVVKKDGDWWHGIISNRTGIFPSNYVQLFTKRLETTTEEQPQQQDQTSIVEKPLEEIVTAPIKQESVDITAQVTANEVREDEPLEVGKAKKGEIYQVIAPYDATSHNQLSLQRGMLVMVRKKTATGWWEGELQAKGKKKQLGWFPASYVKPMGGSSRTTPVSMEMAGKEETPPTETGGFVLNAVKVPLKRDSPEDVKETVKALYPYEANNDDELTFGPGDIITVLDKEDSAWWKGHLRGFTGVFPSNYVEPFTMPDQQILAAKAAQAQTKVASPEGEIDSLC